MIEGQHASVEAVREEIEFTRDRVLQQLETDAIAHQRELVHLTNYLRSEFTHINAMLAARNGQASEPITSIDVDQVLRLSEETRVALINRIDSYHAPPLRAMM